MTKTIKFVSLSFALDALVHNFTEAVRAGDYHHYELLGFKDKLFQIIRDALQAHCGLEMSQWQVLMQLS